MEAEFCLNVEQDNNTVAQNILAKVMVAKISNREYKKLDLTHGQKILLWHVLITGKNGTELSMTDISNIMEITKSAASQTVSKLERKGLLKRRWARGDRRRILVFLTTKGQAMADTFYSDIIQYIEGALNKLSDEERTILIRIVEKCLE